MRSIHSVFARILLFTTLLLLVFINPSFSKSSSAPTLILIRPLEKQIENLVVLKAQALLDDDVQVIAVYHQDELTDYTEAREYVRREGLDWVRFQTISGGINLNSGKPGRGTNEWTSQFTSLFYESDGIIFTGGMDFPPRFYGEETRLTSEVTTPIRSVYELSFLHHLIGDGSNADSDSQIPFLSKRQDYTILCICLGCQTLNVAAGGTLIQNIPSQVYGLNSYESVLRLPEDQIHSGRYISGLNSHLAKMLPPSLHRIRANGQGRITSSLFSGGHKNPQILSSHHQALGQIGKNLLVTASSMDGKITEMVEHEAFPAVLGVQFHPEAMSLYRRDIRYRRVGRFSDHVGKDAPLNQKKREWLNYGPIAEADEINLREELENSDSFTFHRHLWRWFSSSLRQSSKKTKS